VSSSRPRCAKRGASQMDAARTRSASSSRRRRFFLCLRFRCFRCFLCFCSSCAAVRWHGTDCAHSVRGWHGRACALAFLVLGSARLHAQGTRCTKRRRPAPTGAPLALSSACRRVGRAHPLLSLYWPPLPEAALGDARRARTRGRAVCPGPPSRPAAACAASLRSTRLQRHNHAQRQARQTLMCAPGAPAAARACPSGEPLAGPDRPAAASRRRARAAGSCRRPPPHAPRAPGRPACSPCAAAPPTAAAPGAPAGDGAAASKLAAAPGASMRAPGAAVWSDAAGAGALGSRLLSARRGGHATRSTSCEKVSRPRSAPYTVVACRARRGGLPWA